MTKGTQDLEIQYVAPTALKPFERNPKKHPEHQIISLVKAIKQFGWTNPILVSEDYTIVAGHARLLAGLRMGMESVPIIKLDMTYEEALAYVVADNQLSAIAITDFPVLQDLLKDISGMADIDMGSLGFEDYELDKYLADSLSDVNMEIATKRAAKPAAKKDTPLSDKPSKPAGVNSPSPKMDEEPANSDAPEDFKEYDENICTDNECPRCGYTW